MYLIGEERGYDGEEARYEVMILDNMGRDRWDSEELQCKVFDRRLRFSVN